MRDSFSCFAPDLRHPLHDLDYAGRLISLSPVWCRRQIRAIGFDEDAVCRHNSGGFANLLPGPVRYDAREGNVQAPLQKTRKFRWPPSVAVNDAGSLVVAQAPRRLAKGVSDVDYNREAGVGRQLKMRLERTLLDRPGLEVAIEVQSGLADCDDGWMLGQQRKLGDSVLVGFVGTVRMDSDGGEQTLAIRGELDGPAAGRQVISDYNRGGHAGAVRAPPDLLGVAAEPGRVQVDVRIEYGQLN